MKYETPEIEFVILDCIDVLTTSLGGNIDQDTNDLGITLPGTQN